MRRILTTLPYVLRLILVVGLVATTTQAFADSGFSEGDVKGDYGVAFDGALSQDGGLSFVPVAAIGQLHSDGKGNVNFVRTLNISGLILEQTGTGTYDVLPDGTGTAEFTVTNVSPSLPASNFPNTFETFSFVIINGREIEFIGKTIEGLNEDGTTFPIGQGTIRGVARKQSGSSDDDD